MIINVLLIYVMGALIGLGLSYTISSSSWYDEKERGSRNRFIFYSTLSSWLSLVALLVGICTGLWRIWKIIKGDAGGNAD